MAVTDGMAVAWTSPMIPYFLSEKSHIKMSRSQAEWMETFLLLGAFSGLPVTAYVTNKLGRKKSLILACSTLVLTWTVIALTTRIEYIDGSRFLQGLGLNMAFVAAPMYVGEISHKSIRGLLSSSIFIMNVLGVLIMYTTGPLLPYYVPSIIAILFLTLEITVFIFLPESPHYLLIKNKDIEAERSLQRLRRCLDVGEELTEIKNAIDEEKKLNHVGLKELVIVKNYRKALVIMTFLNAGQLFCSSEVILMNLHDILDSAGSIYVNAATAGILFSLLNLVASLAASVILDRHGRVKLLIISVILTGICLFLLALYFHLKMMGYDTRNYSWLPIVTVMAYGIVFRIGLGMVPIVMTSELFASRIKSFGMCFADGVYVGSSVLALQTFFFLKNNFGLHVSFYVFFSCSLLMCFFVLFYVPETKGKSLEEIQRMLKNESQNETEEQHKMLNLSKQY